MKSSLFLLTSIFACMHPAFSQLSQLDSTTAQLVSISELTAYGQNQENGTISGTVVNASEGVPLEGAKVEVLGTETSTTTHKSGQYKISSLPAGIYQVRASIAGHTLEIRNNVVVEAGKEQHVFFYLKPESDVPPEFLPVEKQPMSIKNPAPLYPESARRRGMEGIVWLKLVVDEQGDVGKIEIAKADASGDLINAAMDAAKQWKFTPAIWGGKPVKVWVSVPFKFTLDSAGKKLGNLETILKVRSTSQSQVTFEYSYVKVDSSRTRSEFRTGKLKTPHDFRIKAQYFNAIFHCETLIFVEGESSFKDGKKHATNAHATDMVWDIGGGSIGVVVLK